MQHTHLKRAKLIHKRQTHPLVREDVTQGLCPQGFSCQNNSLVVNLKGLGAETN
jgi:hypothetical protein